MDGRAADAVDAEVELQHVAEVGGRGELGALDDARDEVAARVGARAGDEGQLVDDGQHPAAEQAAELVQVLLPHEHVVLEGPCHGRMIGARPRGRQRCEGLASFLLLLSLCCCRAVVFGSAFALGKAERPKTE